MAPRTSGTAVGLHSSGRMFALVAGFLPAGLLGGCVSIAE